MAATTAVVGTEKHQTLYELSDDLQALIDTIEGCEDEAQLVELLDKQQAKLEQFVSKVDAYVGFINRQETEIAAFKEQCQRMDKAFYRAINKRETALNGLEYIAGVVLRKLGVREITGLIHKIRLHKNPDKPDITDYSRIPNRFVSTSTTVNYDRRAIVAALKRGEEVPGARLITGADRVEFS